MNDTQRQQYLGAMGIASWFPRVVLPYALSSSLTELDQIELDQEEIESSVLSQSNIGKVELEGGVSADGNQNPLVDMPVVSSAVPVIDDSQPSADKVIKAEENKISSLISLQDNQTLKTATDIIADKVSTQALTPNFKLCMTFFSSGHLLVDTLGGEGLTSDVQRFYQAFGFALQHDNQQLQQSLFKWPLFNNRGIDQSESIARTSCLQHIQQTLSQRPEVFVLLGDAASRYAASDGAITMKESVMDIMSSPSSKIEVARKLELI
jgi:hypothetical protein